MLDIFFQFDLFRQFIDTAVNLRTDKAAPSGLLQYPGMFSLTPLDHRRQQLDLRPLRQLHNLVHHLIHRLLPDLPAALWTVRNADSGIEQTKIVIDLRHRPHRGTGIAVGGLLIDGNGGRETFNAFHIRLLHLAQELPRIGRQRFHIPSLPLGIDCIKSKGGLA